MAAASSVGMMGAPRRLRVSLAAAHDEGDFDLAAEEVISAVQKIFQGGR